jgi:hypothetical protein
MCDKKKKNILHCGSIFSFLKIFAGFFFFRPYGSSLPGNIPPAAFLGGGEVPGG